MLLISGLPESGWSESDIIKLVQPFGVPSDIILAKQIGKVGINTVPCETFTVSRKKHSRPPVIQVADESPEFYTVYK